MIYSLTATLSDDYNSPNCKYYEHNEPYCCTGKETESTLCSFRVIVYRGFTPYLFTWFTIYNIAFISNWNLVGVPTASLTCLHFIFGWFSCLVISLISCLISCLVTRLIVGLIPCIIAGIVIWVWITIFA